MHRDAEGGICRIRGLKGGTHVQKNWGANRSETEESEMAMTVKSIFLSDGTHLRLWALLPWQKCFKPLQIFKAQERCNCLFFLPTSKHAHNTNTPQRQPAANHSQQTLTGKKKKRKKENGSFFQHLFSLTEKQLWRWCWRLHTFQHQRTQEHVKDNTHTTELQISTGWWRDKATIIGS